MPTFFTAPSHVGQRIVSVSGRVREVSEGYLKYIYYRARTRNGAGTHNFFNSENDVLSFSQAKYHLSYENQLQLESDDFSTLCIAPHYSFYWCLAAIGKREAAFQDVVRQVIKMLTDEFQITARWVAAINSDNYYPLARIVFAKFVFNRQTKRHQQIHRLFPPAAWKRAAPIEKNTNHIEDVCAYAFLNRALAEDDFDGRVDDLVKTAREKDFQLPSSYLILRSLDGKNELLTKPEVLMKEQKEKA